MTKRNAFLVVSLLFGLAPAFAVAESAWVAQFRKINLTIVERVPFSSKAEQKGMSGWLYIGGERFGSHHPKITSATEMYCQVMPGTIETLEKGTHFEGVVDALTSVGGRYDIESSIEIDGVYYRTYLATLFAKPKGQFSIWCAKKGKAELTQADMNKILGKSYDVTYLAPEKKKTVDTTTQEKVHGEARLTPAE